jgi:hypothetical protein
LERGVAEHAIDDGLDLFERFCVLGNWAKSPAEFFKIEAARNGSPFCSQSLIGRTPAPMLPTKEYFVFRLMAKNAGMAAIWKRDAVGSYDDGTSSIRWKHRVSISGEFA